MVHYLSLLAPQSIWDCCFPAGGSANRRRKPSTLTNFTSDDPANQMSFFSNQLANHIALRRKQHGDHRQVKKSRKTRLGANRVPPGQDRQQRTDCSAKRRDHPPGSAGATTPTRRPPGTGWKAAREPQTAVQPSIAVSPRLKNVHGRSLKPHGALQGPQKSRPGWQPVCMINGKAKMNFHMTFLPFYYRN